MYFAVEGRTVRVAFSGRPACQRARSEGGSPREETRQRIADWSSILGGLSATGGGSFAGKLITGPDNSGALQGKDAIARSQAANFPMRLTA